MSLRFQARVWLISFAYPFARYRIKAQVEERGLGELDNLLRRINFHLAVSLKVMIRFA
jgi:hypothetical protein